MKVLDVVGLCGSRRKGSINMMALRLAGEVMPESMKLEIVDWSDVLPFDADAMAEGLPTNVVALRERLRVADAVLIATPEYNFSIPGMLKNAIDWVSRGADQPFARKPVAILSAAPGPVGGSRVQYDLRKVLLFLDAMVLQKPEVFISNSVSKFAADGQCIDEQTKAFVGAQMAALHLWVQQIAQMELREGPT